MQKIEEFKETSKKLFDEACDPQSLIQINLEEHTFKAVIDKFFSTNTNKTDLKTLVGLMDFWDKKTSCICIESFDVFRLRTGVELANPNLSRSLKSLEQKGFIMKFGNQNQLEYMFKIPFEILESEMKIKGM